MPPTQTPKRRLTLRHLMLFIAVAAVSLAVVHELAKGRERAHLMRQIARNRLTYVRNWVALKELKRKGATPAEIGPLERTQERLRRDRETFDRQLGELGR